MTAPSAELARLRRGVGALYVFSGVLHWAEMALVLLAAANRLPFTISPRGWTQLLFGHFLILIVGGILYLAISYYRSGLFTFHALLDYLVGIPVFMVGFTLAAEALHGGARAWVAFVPGAFLALYGAALRRGKSIFAGRPSAA